MTDDPRESAAWYGPTLAEGTGWIHHVTTSEAAEIADAARTVRRDGRRLETVGVEDYPLRHLGARLIRMRQEVVHGRGFVLLRGFPVDRLTADDIIAAYWIVGRHFGEAVSQNAKGHLVGHVRDIGHDPTNPHHRLYATKARQRFHTDSCDIVGLLCLQPAKTGGTSSIVSSVTIYREMRRRHPDLAQVLCEPFFVDRKGEIPEGKAPYYAMPVFNRYAGHLTTIYARDFIEAAQRFPEVPRLTSQQIEAMDEVDALAGSDALRLDMELQAGDIQFLHNHQILHARTAFEDYREPERRRHLLRLWLSPPDGRPLPPVFAERYGPIERGRRRGGIVVPGARLHIPMQAE